VTGRRQSPYRDWQAATAAAVASDLKFQVSSSRIMVSLTRPLMHSGVRCSNASRDGESSSSSSFVSAARAHDNAGPADSKTVYFFFSWKNIGAMPKKFTNPLLLPIEVHCNISSNPEDNFFMIFPARMFAVRKIKASCG
jgi:hypothetical protein